MRLLVLILIFFVSCIFYAQESAIEKISALVEKAYTEKAFEHALIGLSIAETKSGKQLFEHNAKVSLVPASTMKIITTGAALGILKPGFRYETKLLYTGNFDSVNGIINGDLIIKGSGDPTLQSSYFYKKNDSDLVVEQWAKVLTKKGVKRIQGQIIADNSVFDEEIPSTWIWGDMGNYFGAGANGLSYRDNKYTIYYSSSNVTGEDAKVSKVFPVINLRFENFVKSGGKEDNAFIYSAPGSDKALVKGTIPCGKTNFEVDGSMPDPALQLAKEFLTALQQAGITVSDTIPDKHAYRYPVYQGETKSLFIHRSQPIEKIIFRTNMHSNNHYAESLLKTLGYKRSGLGTTSSGIDAVIDFWKSRGVDVSGLFMTDGSGLSRANGISPATHTAILSKISRDSVIFRHFLNSLPVAGVSGTLTWFGKGTNLVNNLRAKSGYINRARAYAGYFKTKSGKEICFSIIANNYNCSAAEAKKKLEDILELLGDL